MNVTMQISKFTASWHILKNIWELQAKYFFFEIHKSALDSVDVTMRKILNSIILT